VNAGVIAARIDWQQGGAALRRARRGLDPARAEAIDRAERELRRDIARRLGPSFSILDLYRLYLEADRFAPETIARSAAPVPVARFVTPIVDSAFGALERQARDADT
jgi:hypothetical protein